MARKTLLLSIKPTYADLIFSGCKTTELRRIRPGIGCGDSIVVYASSPCCSVLGTVQVSGVLEGTPRVLWPSVRDSCGLSRQQYLQYFDGAQRAFAIQLTGARLRTHPITLAELRRRSPCASPPQAYKYLSGKDELRIWTGARGY